MHSTGYNAGDRSCYARSEQTDILALPCIQVGEHQAWHQLEVLVHIGFRDCYHEMQSVVRLPLPCMCSWRVLRTPVTKEPKTCTVADGQMLCTASVTRARAAFRASISLLLGAKKRQNSTSSVQQPISALGLNLGLEKSGCQVQGFQGTTE